MRLKKTLLFLFLLLIIPKKVLANEYLFCQLSATSVHKGDTVTFTITLHNAVAKLGLTSTNTNVATLSGDNEIFIDSSLNTSQTITVRGENVGQTKIRVNTIEAGNWNQETFTESCEATLNVTEYSTNNYLSSLSISGATLSPSFNKNTLQYTATVNVENVTISATKEDSKATVTGTGAKSLNYGQNAFSIQVKSESGSTRTYQVIINRPKPSTKKQTVDTTKKDDQPQPTTSEEPTKSKNNNLTSLSITGYELNFDPNTTKYEITVNSDVTELETIFEVEDTKSTASVEGNKDLKYGSNNIIVTVISESGDAKQYEILVNRKSPTECLLKELKIENYNINFDSEKYSYNIKINDEEALNIIALPYNEQAVVSIEENADLTDGSKIYIKVKTEDKEAVYTINIIKEIEIDQSVQQTSLESFILTSIGAVTLGVLFIILYLKKNL